MQSKLVIAVFCIIQITNCLGQVERTSLPFGIKEWRDDPEVLKILQEVSLRSEESSLTSSTPRGIKKLFRHKKDGIVQEVIFKGQVDCDSKIYYSAANRRNNNSSVNGRIYQPYYRKDLIKDEYFKLRRSEFEKRLSEDLRDNKRLLIKTKSQLKGFKAAKKRAKRPELKSRWQKSINSYRALTRLIRDNRKQLKKEDWRPIFWQFQIPPSEYVDYNEVAEINLLLLRKNRIVHAFYHKKVRDEGVFIDSLSIPELVVDSSSITLEPLYKELITEIDFERNVTTIHSDSLDHIIERIDNHLLDSISLIAFASIEGTFELNQRLFRKRADNLYQSLSKYHSPEVSFSHKMSENWPLFYEQVRRDTVYSSWGSLSQDSIRALMKVYLNQDPWEGYLKEQRRATVRVIMHEPIDTLSYLTKRFDLKNLDQLTEVQNYMIKAAKMGQLNPKYIFDLKLNKDSTVFSPLILNRYLLELELFSNTGKFDYRNYSRRFFRNINIRKASTKLLSTYLTILVRYWDECSPSIPSNFRLFSELQGRGANTRAMAIFALKAIEYYKDYFTTKKAKYYPKYVWAQEYFYELPHAVYDFYIQDGVFKSSPKNYESLARFFIEHNSLKLANSVLKACQEIHGYDEKLKGIQLKINYTHPSQDGRRYIINLIEEKSHMTKSNWCSLFEGENQISFQAFDDPELRDLYCSSCINE